MATKKVTKKVAPKKKVAAKKPAPKAKAKKQFNKEKLLRGIMSEIAIQRFLSELAELKHRSGKPNESSIRLAFIKLLGDYAKAKDLRLVPEVPVRGKLGKNVTPDGTLKDTLVLDWGSEDNRYITNRYSSIINNCGRERR